jgi:hypothetical protein
MLLAEKEKFRDLERAYASQHLDRLSGQTVQSIETSSLHLDIISDMRRINSFFCSTAYPILEQAGSSVTPASRAGRPRALLKTDRRARRFPGAPARGETTAPATPPAGPGPGRGDDARLDEEGGGAPVLPDQRRQEVAVEGRGQAITPMVADAVASAMGSVSPMDSRAGS